MITERGRALAARPRVSALRVPNLSEIDFGALRAGRLARLQAMMKRHGLPVCLFYGTANIRYATGVDVMGVWTAGTFARYCVVPAEGAPVLFEYKGSVHVAQKLVQDVRPAFTWQFGGTESAGQGAGVGPVRSARCCGRWGWTGSRWPSTASTRSGSSRSRPRGSGSSTRARRRSTRAR